MNSHLSSPRVYISVLNWNSYEQTIACVRLLQKLDYDNYEIIVVDNASQDGSPEHIRKAFPDLRLIVAEENLGYAAGHQYTADLALAEGAGLLWLVNTDITFEPNVLSALVDAYLEHGDAIYGSLLVAAEDSTRIARDFFGPPIGGRPYNENIVIRSGQSCNDLVGDRNVLHVENVSGCSIFIPVEIIRNFGFMDVNFFMYSEEKDYCYEMYNNNIKSYIISDSTVQHRDRGTQTSFELELILKYYLRRNEFFMRRKYLGYRRFFSTMLTMSSMKLMVKKLLNSLGLLEYLQKTMTVNEHIQWLAWRDAMLNHRGKTLSPDMQFSDKNYLAKRYGSHLNHHDR